MNLFIVECRREYDPDEVRLGVVIASKRRKRLAGARTASQLTKLPRLAFSELARLPPDIVNVRHGEVHRRRPTSA